MIKEINEGDTSDTEKKITQYSYDLNGNLTKVIKPSGKEINYEYNSLNLPTKVIYDINNYTTFEYDENGNRKKMSDVSASGTSITSYAYDVNDRIIQYVQDGIALDYIYDNSNNVKKVQYKEGSIDREIEYIYDSFNRINSINLSGKKLRDYLYIHSGLITKYYYDRGALLFTTGENTSLRATENILDPAGSIIASKRFDGNYENMYFFYNYDIRGSVTNIIAPDGNLVKGYSYDEFGNMEPVGDKNFLNDVTFTGAVHDTSTGLYYMNARFYNPSTGRFITQDSYSGNAYEPWTQHLYSYVGNNPVSMIDPTGHKAISITDSGGKELPPPEKSVSSRVDKVITGSFLTYLGYTALTVGIAVAGVATGESDKDKGGPPMPHCKPSLPSGCGLRPHAFILHKKSNGGFTSKLV